MNLFIKELWDLRWRILVFAVLITGTAVFVMGGRDLFLASLDMRELQGALQASPIKRFISPEDVARQIGALMNDPALYLWSQWFGKNLLQIVLLMTILLGFSSFAREREQGTFSFLLTNQSRATVYKAKLSAGLASLLLLTALGSCLAVWLAPLAETDLTVRQAGGYFLHLASAAVFLYGIVFFQSLLSRDAVKPIILSVLIFAAFSVPGRIPSLEGLHLYRYMSGADFFLGRGIQLDAVLVLIALSLGIYCLGWRVFQQQDF